MDLSKLPKLSQTPPPPPADAPPIPDAPAPIQAVTMFCRCGSPITPGTRFCSNCGSSYDQATGQTRSASPVMAMIPEAFISVIVAALLIYMSLNFWRHHTGNIAAIPQVTDFQTGAVIPYRDTVFYQSDRGVGVFAIILILEGVVLLLARFKPVIILGVLLAIFAVILNVMAIAHCLPVNGFQIVNGMCVGFGIYIALQQLLLLSRKG